MSRVRVVVPTWNVRARLRACLRSLAEHAGEELEVVCVDDGGSDGSDDMVRSEFPWVRLVRLERNQGYAHACNVGLEGRLPEYVLLLNADAELAAGTLPALVEFLGRNPEHAAVAPRLVSPDGSTQRACMAFPRMRTVLWFGTPLERWAPRSSELQRYFMQAFDHEHARDVDQPPGACLLVRGRLLEELRERDGAVFDERLSLFFNDVDLSLRLAQLGWATHYLASVQVLHHLGQSTRQRSDRLLRWHLDRLAYVRKHEGPLAGTFCKSCVVWSFLDHATQQGLRHLRGRPREPLTAVLRSLGTFLAA